MVDSLCASTHDKVLSIRIFSRINVQNWMKRTVPYCVTFCFEKSLMRWKLHGGSLSSSSPRLLPVSLLTSRLHSHEELERREKFLKPPDVVPRQTMSASTEPPMPSFHTANRMLLFHTLERIHDQTDNNGENPLKPPDTSPRQTTSPSTVQKLVRTTEPPMPSFQTSNRMLFHTSERMHDNQMNNNEKLSASTVSPHTPLTALAVNTSRTETLWSRPGNSTAFAWPALPVVGNRAGDPIRTVQSRVTLNSPGTSALNVGVSNSLQDTHLMTHAVAPDPTSLWPMPNGSDDSQGLYSNFLTPQQEERSRKPATLAHNTCVSQVRNKWPGTPQTSQYSRDGSEDGPASDPRSSENFEASPPETDKQGLKRRLGMGRVTGGYSNKKFKVPYQA